MNKFYFKTHKSVYKPMNCVMYRAICINIKSIVIVISKPQRSMPRPNILKNNK